MNIDGVAAELFEAASDGVLLIGESGRIEAANAAAVRLTGYARQALIGLAIEKLVPERLRAGHRRLRHDFAAAREARSMSRGRRLPLRMADGRQRPVTVALATLTSGGRPLVAATLRDVSRELRAERELRRLAVFAERTLEGVVATDERGTVRWANEGFGKIVGCGSDETIGRNLWDLVDLPAADRGVVESTMQAVAAGGDGVGQVIFRWRHPELGERWAEVEVLRNPERKRGGGWLLVGRDITERVQTQRALEREREELECRVTERTRELAAERDRARAASRAKDTFLATVSHEVRTPLHGIIGALDVLRSAPAQDLREAMLKRASASAQHMLRIISDILDFAKIESGEFKFDVDAFDPRSMLEETADSLWGLAHMNGVALVVDIDPAIGGVVMGDATRLRQVIYNLAGNAIKFSAGRAMPEVLLRAMVRAGEERALCLTLTISDNGIGMDAATLARVFEPFTQAETGTQRRYGGTGLGLTISRWLITRAGGRLTVDSTAGEGTTVTVDLRLPRASPSEPVGLPSAVAGLRVLHLRAGSRIDAVVERYLRHAGCSTQAMVIWTPGRLRAALRAARYDVVVVHAVIHETLLACGWAKDAPPLVCLGEPVEPLSQAVTALRPVHYEQLLAALARAAGRSSAVGAESDGETPPAIALTPVDPAALEREGRLVLLVEDNPINRRVLKAQLELSGWGCVAAADGREALELLDDHRYAAVLTDLHMPRLDGIGLAEAIRAREPPTGPRLPLLVLSADVGENIRRRCREVGVDAVLGKPIESHVLQQALHRYAPSVRGDGARARVLGKAAPNTPREAIPVFDPEALGRLVGDAPDLHRELLSEFRAAAADMLSELAAAAAANACEAAGHVAHKLKSSAAAVGGMRLAAACRSLELAACDAEADGDWQTSTTLVTRAWDDFAAAMAARGDD